MALSTALLVKGGVAASTVALGGVAIFQRENIYYLIYPNDNRGLNDKIRALGISGCELENKQTKKENCTLSNEQLKDVKFSDKSGAEVKVTEDSKTLTLTIEKLGDSFKTDFPEGLRFTLKNTQDADLDIGTDSNNKITLKKNIDYDFKIKTADDKSLKLEKAWTLKTLASKVGLTCTDSSAECCTTGTSINIWKDGSNYKIGATGETGKKITVAKDSEGYPEGFKFTVGESTDITINGGTDKGTAITQLTKENMSYEIALKDDNGTKKWFLVEKDATASVPQESQ